MRKEKYTKDKVGEGGDEDEVRIDKVKEEMMKRGKRVNLRKIKGVIYDLIKSNQIVKI